MNILEKITNYNPQILIWARQMSNLDEESIISCMGDDRYKKWESGLDKPTFVQLERLMDLYKFPVVICFFSEPPEYEDTKINFRTIPKAIIDNVDFKMVRLFNKAKSFQVSLRELDMINKSPLQSTIINAWSKKLTKKEKLELVKSLPNNAMDYKKIKGAKHLFDFWRDTLFEYGIYIFKDSFGDDSVSGFSIYDERYPIIYINNKLAFTRQLFTLFHELYHLFENTNGIDFTSDEFFEEYDYNLDIEYACNDFSANFLVPVNDLRQLLVRGKISAEYIRTIADHFRVSRDVISRRLFDLRFISFEEYEQYKRMFYYDYQRKSRSLKDGKQHGDYINNQMSYLGNKYLELVFSNYYNQKITIQDIGRYTNLKYSSIIEIAIRKNWRDV